MIDILIPVLGRPQNAAKVVASISAATDNPYTVTFICSPGDRKQIAACRRVGDVIVVDWEPGRADFAKKINHAFDLTSQEWILQGADDLDFHPHWDTNAFTLAQQTGKSVVGTNDLHNPAVRARRHATHILFRRDYITRYGAGTIDNSGVVFSEVYDHQFVDTEFVTIARRRNEWVFAVDSVVEHLHPYWGLSPRDATYDKGVREAQKDLDLYRSRIRLLNRAKARAR